MLSRPATGSTSSRDGGRRGVRRRTAGQYRAAEDDWAGRKFLNRSCAAGRRARASAAAVPSRRPDLGKVLNSPPLHRSPQISQDAAALRIRSAATADPSRRVPSQDRLAEPGRFRHLEPAHPCGRGERGAQVTRVAAEGGSSPRARGTVLLERFDMGRDGSSPRARGTGSDQPCTPRSAPVHPRGRGERACDLRHGRCMSGSSPRARGTDLDRAAVM